MRLGDLWRLNTRALCAGSMPPNHFSDASAAFPSQYSEPPTSDDMAYVPMSSFGPESSLAPATTSDRGELNYVYAEPSRPDPAFPSPFAVRFRPPASHAATPTVRPMGEIPESLGRVNRVDAASSLTKGVLRPASIWASEPWPPGEGRHKRFPQKVRT